MPTSCNWISATGPPLLLLLLLLLLSPAALAMDGDDAGESECSLCKSGNCTVEFRIVCRCTDGRQVEIIDEEKGTSKKASIGFVIDTSGSMRGEILTIKKYIRDLAESGNGSVNKFVLGEFMEPYETSLVQSRRPSEVYGFLRRLRATGGADCPETALHGIRDVASAVSNNSILFLFTDASAGDGELEAEVTQLLLRKNIRLHLVATGEMCNNNTLELYRVAAATNGTVLLTNVKDMTVANAALIYMRRFLSLGVHFLRAMPQSVKDLQSITIGDCSLCNATKTVKCWPVDSSTVLVEVPAVSSMTIVLLLLALLLLLLALLLLSWLATCCCGKSSRSEERRQLVK